MTRNIHASQSCAEKASFTCYFWCTNPTSVLILRMCHCFVVVMQQRRLQQHQYCHFNNFELQLQKSPLAVVFLSFSLSLPRMSKRGHFQNYNLVIGT